MAEPLNKHALQRPRIGTIPDTTLVLTQSRLETLFEMNERLVPTLSHEIGDETLDISGGKPSTRRFGSRTDLE